jgi:hypothetical protein
VAPQGLLLREAGIARAVEHMDRRIGDLFRHAEAADKFSIGQEQRRLGAHVTNHGALLAAGLRSPVLRTIALALVYFATPTKEGAGPKPFAHRRRDWPK